MSWQYTFAFSETLAGNQRDAVAFVNRPAAGSLVDRMIQNDSFSFFPNYNVQETLTLFDGLRFALTPSVLLLGDRIILSDAASIPNLDITQFPREVVVLPTAQNLKLTQLPREVVVAPTATNLRLTQMVRELVMQFPEAFLAQEDYLMSITDQLVLKDTLTGFNPGLYFMVIGESNQPGLKDQTGEDNIRVKKNQVIKATNLQSSDTTLNHWTERLQINFTPTSSFQSFSDQLSQSDSIATLLPVVLAEVLNDQQATLADTVPALRLGMQQPFIQTLNLWQEFFAQPYLGIFAESNSDQWQDSLAGFMPYFMPLSDSFTLTDSIGLPIAEVFSDTLSMSDFLAVGYGQGIVESLTMTDASSVSYGDQIADQLTQADSLVLGYGQGNVDALTFSDSMGIGYGDSVTDQLTQSDSFSIAEALDELLSDDEGPNWADSFASKGGGLNPADQLVLTDSFMLGYGNYLPDTIVMTDGNKLLFGIGMQVFEQIAFSDSMGQFPGLFIVDQLQLSDTIQLPVWLSLADQLAQSDSIGAGYGSRMSDQTSMADAMNLVESFETLLQDATPAMLENLQQLFNYLLTINDGQTMVEQMNLMYGLLVSGEFMEFDDELNVVGVVLPFLSDDASQNWLDAVLFEFIFAPGEILVREFKLLNRMLADEIDTRQQQQADRFKTQAEQQAEFEVLLDGEV